MAACSRTPQDCDKLRLQQHACVRSSSPRGAGDWLECAQRGNRAYSEHSCTACSVRWRPAVACMVDASLVSMHMHACYTSGGGGARLVLRPVAAHELLEQAHDHAVDMRGIRNGGGKALACTQMADGSSRRFMNGWVLLMLYSTVVHAALPASHSAEVGACASLMLMPACSMHTYMT